MFLAFIVAIASIVKIIVAASTAVRYIVFVVLRDNCGGRRAAAEGLGVGKEEGGR